MTSPADRSSGFTLFELLIVLAIMGLLTALIVLRGPFGSHGLSLRHAASDIAEALRETRSRAIGTDRPVVMTVDIEHRTYAVGAARPEHLPGRFTISVATAAGEVRAQMVAGIRFDPDGSSSGGRITLEDGGHKVAIGVDWLNGAVSVADAS
ncbi:MAG TPA: GspH/FimT family pseudopilin [Stellaceae bacterium]|nr:GspH/FimT family pseudopilin [Stellaceae bacterium]